MSRVADDILLCEQCGYTLEGLEPDAHPDARCPECGTLVAWSLPARRPGTAWQQARTPTAWLETSLRALRSPRGQFDVMQVAPRERWSLLWSYLLLAGVLLSAPFAGMGLVRANFPPRGERVIQELALYVGGSLLNFALVVGGLWLLTWIEVIGIRFFAARRGWRLTESAAWQVASHAGVGWVLSGVLMLFGLAIPFAIDRIAPRLLGHRLDLTWASLGYIGVREITQGVLILGGAFAGMLVFETLVYLGVTRCRYANMPRDREGSEAGDRNSAAQPSFSTTTSA